jgi:integrating conjugative element protein (TIGR03746 family)
MLNLNAWKKEDRDRALIRTLRGGIGLLFVLCIVLAAGWMTAPSHLRIYIPPDISNGATLKINEVPNPLIYSFAYELWQEINYWPEDGSQDYGKNLKVYAAYLTPDFQQALRQELIDLKAAGQLQRQRFIQGISGAAYNPENVKKISADTWEVDINVRLMEFKNNQPVKDIEVLYPLKITRHEVSHQDNPYGLALAGFMSAPIRGKTSI